jgi:hypothetical protein
VIRKGAPLCRFGLLSIEARDRDISQDAPPWGLSTYDSQGREVRVEREGPPEVLEFGKRGKM